VPPWRVAGQLYFTLLDFEILLSPTCFMEACETEQTGRESLLLPAHMPESCDCSHVHGPYSEVEVVFMSPALSRNEA
jgi:hypothetical protein